MTALVDSLLILVLLLNFFSLGTTRVKALINGSAAQGVVIGFVALFSQGELTVETAVVAVSAVTLKGIVIPRLLLRALRDVRIRQNIEPFIDYVPSLLMGAVGSGLAILFANTLPLAPEHEGALLVPTSLSTVLTGFLLLTTRRKAISQVIGYLVLENGVFILGLTLVGAMPFLVELGVLLDLLVGIFVMGIMVNHIGREFSSLDTSRLAQLKEE
ncbi:MAG: hydrogenase [Polyangiaceae bacterium]|nr:hydrogenase [Polyangiaceae bacterium]